MFEFIRSIIDRFWFAALRLRYRNNPFERGIFNSLTSEYFAKLLELQQINRAERFGRPAKPLDLGIPGIKNIFDMFNMPQSQVEEYITTDYYNHIIWFVSNIKAKYNDLIKVCFQIQKCDDATSWKIRRLYITSEYFFDSEEIDMYKATALFKQHISKFLGEPEFSYNRWDSRFDDSWLSGEYVVRLRDQNISAADLGYVRIEICHVNDSDIIENVLKEELGILYG